MATLASHVPAPPLSSSACIGQVDERAAVPEAVGLTEGHQSAVALDDVQPINTYARLAAARAAKSESTRSQSLVRAAHSLAMIAVY